MKKRLFISGIMLINIFIFTGILYSYYNNESYNDSPQKVKISVQETTMSNVKILEIEGHRYLVLNQSALHLESCNNPLCVRR